MPAEDFKPFYLFALLLTGNGHEASELIAQTLPVVAAQSRHLRYGHHSRARMVRALREGWSKRSASVEENFTSTEDVERVAQACAILPEPERSVASLFYSNLLDANDAADLLGLSLEEYAAALHAARQKLRPLFELERQES